MADTELGKLLAMLDGIDPDVEWEYRMGSGGRKVVSVVPPGYPVVGVVFVFDFETELLHSVEGFS